MVLSFLKKGTGMITKNICIEFADPRIKAVDHISDICEAADYAHCNLLMRHKIRLHEPYTYKDRVYVKMDIPDKFGEKINCGNRLRGISAYLIKYKGDFYKKHKVGNRIMFYVEDL